METVDSTEWSMEWSCNNCGGMGEVPTNGLNLEEAICIICSHCSHPTLYAWCEKCGVGMGRDEIDLTNRPRAWTCSGCDTEYPIPTLFYQRAKYFKPSKFSELVHVRSNVNFSKYEHINSAWARTVILNWNKHREKMLYFSASALLMGGALGALLKTTSFSLPLGLFALVALIVFAVSGVVDIILWLVSSISILNYKNRKKQE